MILQFIIGYAVSSHQFNFTKFFKFSSSLCKVCVYYSSSSSVIGLAHVIGNAMLPLFVPWISSVNGEVIIIIDGWINAISTMESRQTKRIHVLTNKRNRVFIEEMNWLRN